MARRGERTIGGKVFLLYEAGHYFGREWEPEYNAALDGAKLHWEEVRGFRRPQTGRYYVYVFGHKG